MIGLDVQFGEGRILQSPETEQALLERSIIDTVDVVLAVADRNEVLIPLIDINAGDLPPISQLITLELKEWLDCDSGPCFSVNHNLFLLFLLNFLFFLAQRKRSFSFFILFITPRVLLYLRRRVILVEYVLFVVLGLSQQPFNDADGFCDAIGEFDAHVGDFVGGPGRF